MRTYIFTVILNPNPGYQRNSNTFEFKTTARNDLAAFSQLCLDVQYQDFDQEEVVAVVMTSTETRN